MAGYLYRRKGSPFWQGRFRRGGREYTWSLETEARRVAQERLDAKIDELRAQDWGERPDRTFAQAVDLFTAQHLPRLKQSTRTRYVHSLLVLADHLEGMTLDQIGNAELGLFEAARRAAGIKAPTIRRDLATLSVVYEVATMAEWTDRNPAKPYLRKAKTMGLRESPPRDRWLRHHEEAAIIKACSVLYDGRRQLSARELHARGMLAAAIMFAIDTGLRDEEQLGLLWDHIDLAAEELVILSTRAKSGVARRVPLLPRTLEVLRRLPRHPESRYVFHSINGQRFSELYHALQKVAAIAGVEHVTWHDLRRTCGCRLLQDRGLTMERVSKWLGHSSIKTTERVYAFLSIDDLHRAVGTGSGSRAIENTSDGK